jgi:hypothetical protein
MYITSQSAGIHIVLYRSIVLKIKYCNKTGLKQIMLLELLLIRLKNEIENKSFFISAENSAHRPSKRKQGRAGLIQPLARG